MLNTLALIVVAFFGAALIIVGFAGMIRPDSLMVQLRRLLESSKGWLVAAGIRFALGLALLGAAAVSALPTTFSVFGWLSLLGAVFAVVFRKHLTAIVESLLGRRLWMCRLACTFAAALGAVFIYGVVPAFGG